MKINKHLTRLQKNLKLSIISSFIVIVGSSSVFAASASTCPQSNKAAATACTATKANCKKTVNCKKSAACKKITACKKAAACKSLAGCKLTPATKAPTPTATPSTTTTTSTAPTTTQTSNTVIAYENKVLELVNIERNKAGLSPLTMDETLRTVARKKSEDMQANHYFDHNSPTYGSPFDMMKKFGVTYTMAGENIAMGQRTPEEVVTAWMNSPGHRANILKPGFTHIGVGYVANGNYWTQEFIGK